MGTVRYEREEAVGRLTIDRPESLNALDPDTLRELLRTAREIRRDSAVRAVVLTGAGERAFVAGADIARMVEMTPAEARDFARLGQRATRALEELPVPVIAAVNGFALGGGLELALACDWIVASSKARLGQPEINLGIIPGFGGTQRLPRRIGASRARQMIYGGEMIDAATALGWGLVDEVVEPGELLSTCVSQARDLSHKGPVALAQAKRAILHGLDLDLENALRLEAETFAVAFSTEDRSAGMRAFLEKKRPS